MALCHAYPDPLITASGLKAAPASLTHAVPVGLSVFRSSPLCISAGDGLFLALVFAIVMVICASWEAAVGEAGSGALEQVGSHI